VQGEGGPYLSSIPRFLEQLANTLSLCTGSSELNELLNVKATPKSSIQSCLEKQPLLILKTRGEGGRVGAGCMRARS
jgi:hypothetical protein